ncbi:fatty acyl-AMP ligase [Plantactinospora sonchi]|uniref:Fatty acyl-AMP ligase n=1 Tax=Plantactinospora sonchi TaxID=1544735 RepID=A0ABU7RT51_9ACTN
MTLFVTALGEVVARVPDKPAVLFHRASGVESLTYRELDRAARSVAVWLRDRLPAGDARVVLAHAPGLSFVTAFVGCLYAGVTPVPVPPPTGHRHQVVRSAGIVADSGAAMVLTDPESLPAVLAWRDASGLGDIPCAGPATTPDAGESDPDRWRPPDPDPDRVAFLQYTSGSTSAPKGVMVGHGNLAHNIGLMRDCHGWHGDLVFCSWLPTYHDMGLIAMLLTPLCLGGTAVLLPAMDFLKRPYLWLDLISRYGAQVSCAPNFAYDLTARQVGDEQLGQLDLSHWRYACNGSEPINAGTLERFAARFAPAGFRRAALLPGYGLAEATLYVSGTRVDSPPVVRRVDTAALAADRLVASDGVASGDPVGVTPAALPGPDGPVPTTELVSSGVVRGIEVLVVDPATGVVLPDGQVGEVWIGGGSVASGYWRRPDETAETFGARTADGAGPFLRTGDLGAYLDGELFITGRRKEMLIVNGRNLYPHDVEREAAEVHPVFAELPTCVFSVPGRQGEAIVLVQEIRSRGLTGDDLHGYARTAKTALGARLGVRVGNVVFVRPGRILRTSSGKIQRRAMRDRFLAGTLESLHEDLDPELRVVTSAPSR